jgi:hypothetical protein
VKAFVPAGVLIEIETHAGGVNFGRMQRETAAHDGVVLPALAQIGPSAQQRLAARRAA